MKWTIASLYLLLFLALIGFGWALDKLYDQYQQPEDHLVGYKLSLQIMAKHLSEIENIDQQNAYLESTNLMLQLESYHDFPLPDILDKQLRDNQIIVLDSPDGVSLHTLIAQTNLVLSFQPKLSTLHDKNILQYSFTLVFYLGIALVLVLWFAPLLKIIHQLSNATFQIGQGKLNTRIGTHRPLFLSKLIVDFNQMASRLETLNEQNKILSHAVSHDLRTPLARMKFALEMFSGHSAEQQQQDFLKMDADIQQMESMIDELLSYARLDKTSTIQTCDIDLDILIQQSIAEFYSENCTIAYRNEIDNAVSTSIDAKLIYKAIHNLLQNACKFSNEKVLVIYKASSDFVAVEIHDDGPGVLPSERDKIFDPFYQQQDSIKGNGYGLGLAICKKTVEAHHGAIEASTSEFLTGACFRIALRRVQIKGV